MTILHDAALKHALSSMELIVSPMLDPDTQITSGSIDLRLGTEFLLSRRTRQAGVDPLLVLDTAAAYEQIDVDFGAQFWLQPGQLALGSTLETIRLSENLGAYVLSRSTWGRLGLLVATAVYIQPGFCGVLTLELSNAGESPIALYPGTRVAQLVVHHTAGAAEGYQDKPLSMYRAPTGPQAPDLRRDRADIERAKRALTTLGPRPAP
jgi:dCTP deaminase